MAWARSVPGGARYNLAQSGIEDHLRGGDQAGWDETLSMRDLTVRDHTGEVFYPLLDRIAARYSLPREHVTLSLGASQSITHALMALVRPGDHVIVERPTYEPLHRVPAMLGADVSRLERSFEEDWRALPDRLAKLLRPKTRAVMLTNLHNPTGALISRDELVAIGEMAARVGASVLVDEVYLDFLMPDAPTAASVLDNGVSWSSTTKAFGFSALRAGWIVSNSPETAELMAQTAFFLHVDIPVASARIATKVLDQAESLVERSRSAGQRGLAIVESWLAGEQRVSWVKPVSGLCGYVKLPKLVDEQAFVTLLREEFDTQVVPGSMFEAPGGFRLGFAGRPADLEVGLQNVSRALDSM